MPLTQHEKRKRIAQELRGAPDRSDRQIGLILGVDGKTVALIRRQLEDTGAIPCQQVTAGADGKVRRRHRDTSLPRETIMLDRRENVAPAPGRERIEDGYTCAGCGKRRYWQDESGRWACWYCVPPLGGPVYQWVDR